MKARTPRFPERFPGNVPETQPSPRITTLAGRNHKLRKVLFIFQHGVVRFPIVEFAFAEVAERNRLPKFYKVKNPCPRHNTPSHHRFVFEEVSRENPFCANNPRTHRVPRSPTRQLSVPHPGHLVGLVTAASATTLTPRGSALVLSVTSATPSSVPVLNMPPPIR